MVTPVLQTDIAIIGGGVAGLWALNLLRQRGYSTVLFEQDALGSDQTIGSQGIIHGGIKYATFFGRPCALATSSHATTSCLTSCRNLV